ncbi:hypothetical protein [Actinomadura geliboluensis]|uniref:Uncharacterized protein n=1 Tax=Actinomadura geliboluensis TaxID=882440 RepID=A0A5S4GH66_9ACTN|nr:hypothetical protein [Actinomadura geliboluensis]TMR32318.1 hypothetical protein ETD96_29910 [Actinomadura geliboluensis]
MTATFPVSPGAPISRARCSAAAVSHADGPAPPEQKRRGGPPGAWGTGRRQNPHGLAADAF